MEKLQPLIRHRFWILSGLIILLAVYGYFSANSQLRADTAKREADLAKKLQDVPDGNSPNEDYARKLAEINGFYESSVSEVLVELWKHQQARMTWPKYAHSAAPKDFMGEFPRAIRVLYQQDYPRIMRELEERIQPVMPMLQVTQPTPGRRPMTSPMRNTNTQPQIQVGNIARPDGSIDQSRVPWPQKVILNANLPRANLGQFNITSQQMWDAQIDVWMTRLLIDAVKAINEDKQSVTEAVLRRVDRLELMGGTGEGGGSLMMEGMDEMMGGYEDYGMDEGMMSGIMSQFGGMMTPVVSSVPFDPSQEFGQRMDAAAMGGGDEFGMMSMAMGGPMELRYIGSEDGPFLERGFYMSVIIMQKQIPDFLTHLANSDWPVKVKRFNVGLNPYRTGTNITPAPGAGGLAGAGAFGGGRDMSTIASMLSTAGYGGALEQYGGMFGGMGMSGSTSGNPLAQNLPPFSTAALQHAELVQLDLCGLITMYKPPEEALAAMLAQESGEAPPAADAPQTTEPAEPAEPIGETPALDPALLNESDQEEMPLEPTEESSIDAARQAPPALEAPLTDESPAVEEAVPQAPPFPAEDSAADENAADEPASAEEAAADPF